MSSPTAASDTNTGPSVIVTGGTRGIGRGIVTSFHEAGYRVLVCARSEPAAPLRDGEREALFMTCDVRDPDQVAAVVTRARDEFGCLDVLINNAGGTPVTDVTTASPRFHRSIVELNMLAPLTFSIAANRVMQEQPQGGSIVFISSVAAKFPEVEAVSYAAAKAGLDAMSVGLAKALAPKVRVNTVTVGLVATPDAAQFYTDDAEANVASHIPMGRMGTPADVAGACLLLCDARAAFITGANLACHGGRQVPWVLGSDD
ncbi:MAG: SDR family oxidoreductase [Deltaproteobacteria bacterium]|nr:SDR family oxidoreductase [Deltaproteobacteria bacterium]MBW2363227.1 SDR family oxidoreductase [Deltaproteobacteria bacterium]